MTIELTEAEHRFLCELLAKVTLSGQSPPETFRVFAALMEKVNGGEAE